MRMEDRMYHVTGRIGASALVVGILTLVCGLVLGILGIVNGGRLLKEHRDLMS